MASSASPASSFAEQAAALRSCTEAELRAKGLLATGVPPPPRSAAGCRAALRAELPFAARVAAAQQIIDSLGYSFAPGPSYYFGVDKRLPFRALAASAASMLADPAPLKCVEAAALSLLLTAGWPRVDRLALGFRSRCRAPRQPAGGSGRQEEEGEEERHRHVVLALRDRATGAWAALGASRRPLLLGGTAASFPSLSALVARYAAGYAAVGHRLDKVRVGSPAPHSLRCARRVSWRALRLPLGRAAFAGASAPGGKSGGVGGGGGGGGAWAASAAALDAFAEAPRRAAAAAAAAAGAPRRATDASFASSVSRLASGAASRRASGAAAAGTGGADASFASSLSRRASGAASASGTGGGRGAASERSAPGDAGDDDAREAR